jgi:hypothetical protein
LPGCSDGADSLCSPPEPCLILPLETATVSAYSPENPCFCPGEHVLGSTHRQRDKASNWACRIVSVLTRALDEIQYCSTPRAPLSHRAIAEQQVAIGPCSGGHTHGRLRGPITKTTKRSRSAAARCGGDRQARASRGRLRPRACSPAADRSRARRGRGESWGSRAWRLGCRAVRGAEGCAPHVVVEACHYLLRIGL